MEVRIEAGVGGDDGRWGTAGGEHADQDEVGVVDPVEGWVGGDIEVLGFEHLDAFFSGLEVWVQLVVGVLSWVDKCDGRFSWIRIRCDLDFGTPAIPMGSHHYYALDLVVVCFITALLPVCG